MQPIGEFYHIIADTFWSERFWLPSNFTWSNLNDDPTKFYPQPYHLFVSFPICALLLFLRFLFESFIFKPLGRYYGLQEKTTRPPEDNRQLEKVFKVNKRPQDSEIKALSAELQWSYRRVQRWFQRKRNTMKYSGLKKFSESGWRFTFYLCAFWGGIYTLWSKPYFWETKYCWIGYPKQTVDTDIYWYYMLELGFYWSLLIFVFYDVKRKDFKEMIVHHVSTITLMVFSWSCNYVRVGVLILAVHDAVDYLLEAAKMAKYIGKSRLCEILFITFTTIWVFTRLMIFPFRLLRSTIFEGLAVTGLSPFPAYYALNGLLLVLQMLNMIWFILISKMAFDKLTQGQLQQDVRSDSELSDDASGMNSEVEEEPKDKPETPKAEENGFVETRMSSNGFIFGATEGTARQRAEK